MAVVDPDVAVLGERHDAHRERRRDLVRGRAPAGAVRQRGAAPADEACPQTPDLSLRDFEHQCRVRDRQLSREHPADDRLAPDLVHPTPSFPSRGHGQSR